MRARLVRCLNCGLIYQSPRPSLEEMAAHYPPEYDSYNPDEGRSGPWLLRQAVRYGLRKRMRYITRRLNGGRLLDLGCATGVFLDGMQQLPGWEVAGVEPSPHAAEEARTRFGLDVFTGTLEQAGFPDAHFDAVTLWDVLEHLHDPAGTLREIHRILKPGGYLVARVPNHASWDSKLFGAFWAGLDAPRHLFAFSPATLRRMLAENGFDVRQLSSRIGGYPTFVLSVRFWLAARGRARQGQAPLIRALYHPLARLASGPFFALAGLGVRGPVMVVTARAREDDHA